MIVFIDHDKQPAAGVIGNSRMTTVWIMLWDGIEKGCDAIIRYNRSVDIINPNPVCFDKHNHNLITPASYSRATLCILTDSNPDGTGIRRKPVEGDPKLFAKQAEV
jgi:hypothetical protein